MKMGKVTSMMNGMDESTAENIFRATANLAPDSKIITLLLNGELTEAGKQFLLSYPES